MKNISNFFIFSLDFLNLKIYLYIKGKMKMENKTENKELEIINQVDNLELVDKVISIFNLIEFTIITVGLIGIIAIMI